ESTQKKNYLDSFESFITSENLSANYIIIPGDISNRGTEEELDLFQPFTDRVASALGTPPSNIIIAPGNHDKNWDLHKKNESKPIEDRIKASYECFLAKTSFILESPQYCRRSHSETPFFKVWEDNQIFALTINTSVDDYPESRPHYGSISSPMMKEIVDTLQEASGRAKNKIKACIFHHHPIQYHSPLNDIYPDFS